MCSNCQTASNLLCNIHNFFLEDLHFFVFFWHFPRNVLVLNQVFSGLAPLTFTICPSVWPLDPSVLRWMALHNKRTGACTYSTDLRAWALTWRSRECAPPMAPHLPRERGPARVPAGSCSRHEPPLRNGADVSILLNPSKLVASDLWGTPGKACVAL